MARRPPRDPKAPSKRAPARARELFCRNCGEPSSDLESYCPSCGTLVRLGEEE